MELEMKDFDLATAIDNERKIKQVLLNLRRSSRELRQVGTAAQRSKAPGAAWPCRGSSSSCMARGSWQPL